jgi:iron complex transport system ATP-binding protein
VSSSGSSSRETLVTTLARVAAEPIGAIVVVLHRLEDIPPGFTHAMLLADGGVVAVGPIGEVLTDEAMSTTFGVRLAVHRRGARWAAHAAHPD